MKTTWRVPGVTTGDKKRRARRKLKEDNQPLFFGRNPGQMGFFGFIYFISFLFFLFIVKKENQPTSVGVNNFDRFNDHSFSPNKKQTTHY